MGSMTDRVKNLKVVRMKRIEKILGAFATLAFAATAQAADPRAIAGEIVSVEGTVFVRPDKSGATKELKPAKPGQNVYAGDVVNSSSNGKIKILMKDKSVIDVGPSALFKVDQFKQNGGADREAEMSMMYGTVRASVTQKIQGKGKFNIRTPSATMGVRGTEFVVQSQVADLKTVRQSIANPSTPVPVAKGVESKVTVIQGAVAVETPKVSPTDGARIPASAAAPVMLSAGQALTATADAVAPPKVEVVPPTQMAELKSMATVVDNTFTAAVSIDTSSNSGGSGTGATAAPVMSESMSAMMTAAVQAAPPPVVAMADAGFAGTFGAQQAVQQMVQQAIGPSSMATNFKKLTITIVTQ